MLPLLTASVAVVAPSGPPARELSCLSVRDARGLVVRGRIPGGLLSNVRDVVSKPVVRRATIRAVREEHGARLPISGGIDDGGGSGSATSSGCALSDLRATSPAVQPTPGQVVVEIAWRASGPARAVGRPRSVVLDCGWMLQMAAKSSEDGGGGCAEQTWSDGLAQVWGSGWIAVECSSRRRQLARVQIGPRQAASDILGSGEATRCWSRGRVPCVTAA